MSILTVQNVSYDYVLKSGVTHALRDVTADFEAGTVYAITGRSGSGKTTLLSLIAGFDVPKEGSILYEGAPVDSKNMTEYRRRNIGIVFQAYNLIQHLTALENVTTALEIAGVPKAERADRAKSALLSVGLSEALIKKKPLHLSGGEQQRVAIARAIASDPGVILADEPTGNLDNENSARIVSLLKKCAHETGKCVILITHSTEIAAEADVEYAMSDGVLRIARSSGAT